MKVKMTLFKKHHYLIFVILALGVSLVLGDSDIEIDGGNEVIGKAEGGDNKSQKTFVTGIFPILNGMPCFTENEVSEFRNSRESVTCTCNRSKKTHFAIIRDILTWSCSSTKIASPPLLPPFDFNPPTFLPVTTTTRKPRPFRPFRPSRPKTTTTTTKKPAITDKWDIGTLLPIPELPTSGNKWKLPTKRPQQPQSQWGKPPNSAGASDSDDEKAFRPPTIPPEINLGPQVPQQPAKDDDPGCNYCVMHDTQTTFQCVRAFSYECAEELKRLDYYQVRTECVHDYWTYKQATNICYASEPQRKIYMVIGQNDKQSRPGVNGIK